MKIASHIVFLPVGLLAAAFLLSVAVGSVFIPLNEMFAVLSRSEVSSDAYASILLRVRFPHTALILLTGAALGGSGAAYQGLFRNPLADPYLIGVASGASLGAVFAMSTGWPNGLLGFYAIPAAKTGSQPPIVPPPINQEIARCSSPLERSIRNEVSEVAKELTATPARIMVVAGRVLPIRAREYTVNTVRTEPRKAATGIA